MHCTLVECFFDAMRTVHDEQGTARDYGTGTLLYHAEMSLLEAIHCHPRQSAAALADTLGISRGALTQTAKKLIDKGLVVQYNPPNNRKTKYHRLTEAGEVAREGHARFHAEGNARMRSYLCGLPAADKQVLMGFFRVLEHSGQLCLYECETAGCLCGAQGLIATEGGHTDAGT